VQEPEPVTFPNLRGFSGPTVNSRRKLHLSLAQSQLHFGLPQAAVEILIIKERDIVSVVRCVLLMG